MTLDEFEEIWDDLDPDLQAVVLSDEELATMGNHWGTDPESIRKAYEWHIEHTGGAGVEAYQCALSHGMFDIITLSRVFCVAVEMNHRGQS